MADEDEAKPAAEAAAAPEDDAVIGSPALRPIFLGNLVPNYSPERVMEIFEKPVQPKAEKTYDPLAVERIDQKRGYCFIFLKDAKTQSDKDRAEAFVSDLNGMEVTDVSRALRAEFARGDGRVKRKEDERRKNIAPSETLFVVNFHEETTRREDLEMLFSPFGRLVRIDMKRNYAFVQFESIEQATKAKETTNGGKLDQSILTVEYVARQRTGDDRGGGRDRQRRGGGRYDNRRGGDRWRNDRRRDSPPPYRRRSHSRSRSPPPGGRYGGYRGSRSPPRGRNDDRYDDYRDRRGPSPPYRGRSPDRDRDSYRGDRDRGDRGYRG